MMCLPCTNLDIPKDIILKLEKKMEFLCQIYDFTKKTEKFITHLQTILFH